MYVHGSYAARSTSDLKPTSANARLAIWHDDLNCNSKLKTIMRVSADDYTTDSESSVEGDSDEDDDDDDDDEAICRSQTASIRNAGDLIEAQSRSRLTTLDDELDDVLDAFDDLDIELCGERETLASQLKPEDPDNEIEDADELSSVASTSRTGALASPNPAFRSVNRMRSDSDLKRPSRSVRWLKPSKSSSPVSSASAHSSPTFKRDQLLNVSYSTGPDHLCSSDLLLAAAAASSLTFALSGTWGPQIDPASFCCTSSSSDSSASSTPSSPTMSHSSFHSHCSWSSADMESDFEAYRRFARADESELSSWSSRTSLDSTCEDEELWDDNHPDQQQRNAADDENDGMGDPTLAAPPVTSVPRTKSATSLHRAFLHLGRKKAAKAEAATQQVSTVPGKDLRKVTSVPSRLQLSFVGKLAERRRKIKIAPPAPIIIVDNDVQFTSPAR